MKKGILSTKKLKPNQKNFLLNADLAVLDIDFIHTKTIDFQILNIDYDFLVVTSQNAVKAIVNSTYKKILIEKPVYCVGSKTETELKKNGFFVVKSAHSANELTISLLKEKSYLFFCGDKKLDVLPFYFLQYKIRHEIVEVYQTQFVPKKINSKMDGILFFSPSGVKSFLELNKITNEVCFCIGKTTADELVNSANKIIIANTPSVENVIIQSIKYFKEDKLIE